jgi:hypothetical protein
MSRRLPLASFATLGALAASVALAACGASGSPHDAGASSEQSREQKLLAFTKCLREHGIDVGTPTGGGPVKFKAQEHGTGSAPSPKQFEAAQSACKRYAPTERLNLTPQERVAREEAVRKFAKCMREHGIKLEVQVSDGGKGIGIHVGGAGGPNPQSPGFEAAQKACQALLPKRPARLGAGGPATSSGGAPNAGQQAGG